MNIKNCPKCKRIFTPLNKELICIECQKKEEEEFICVRDYLRENRGQNINIVSEETGVSVKKILQYLKQGRLEITEGMGEFLKCEKCGVSIKTGKFCRNCSEKMAKDLQGVIKGNESNLDTKNSGIKMHLRRY